MQSGILELRKDSELKGVPADHRLFLCTTTCSQAGWVSGDEWESAPNLFLLITPFLSRPLRPPRLDLHVVTFWLAEMKLLTKATQGRKDLLRLWCEGTESDSGKVEVTGAGGSWSHKEATPLLLPLSTRLQPTMSTHTTHSRLEPTVSLRCPTSPHITQPRNSHTNKPGNISHVTLDADNINHHTHGSQGSMS